MNELEAEIAELKARLAKAEAREQAIVENVAWFQVSRRWLIIEGRGRQFSKAIESSVKAGRKPQPPDPHVPVYGKDQHPHSHGG